MVPDHWEMVTLAEVADYRAGRTPARANASFWEGDDATLPWVSIADMTEHQVVRETKEKITQKAADVAFRGRKSPAGTLLMSFKLTIGRIATLGMDAFHNEAIISIFPRKGMNQRYLGYWLSQVDYDRLHDRQIKGNTLNKEKIDRIPVARPHEDEQRRIADTLDAVRASITIQADAVVATTALKRAAMRELMTRGLRGETQKESEIGPVPESWAVRNLRGLFEIKHGFAFSGEYFRPQGEFVLMTPGHFFEGGGFRDQGDKTKYVVGEVPSGYLLNKDDLVIAMTEQKAGLLGSAAFVPDDNRFLHNQRLGLVENLDSDSLDPRFLYHLLALPHVRADLDKTASGSKVRHTSPTKILDVIVAIPTVEEQAEITAVLDAIDAKIDLHKRKKVVLEELFRSLLQKLMTGEIRVADLDLSALQCHKEVAA